jgi:oligopeptide/dipeptide ABC transporter ATP-binding protein
MSTNHPLLQLADFTLRYGKTPVLADLTLDVLAGEVVALVGASGAGKTALLRALLGLSPLGASAQGQLSIEGQCVDLTDEAAWQRRRGRVIGLVPQDPLTSLPAHRRVGALLDEVLRAHGPPRGPVARRAAAELLIESVGLARAHLERYPHALSGGQGQRVLIALALAASPAILLADEPSSALDPLAAAGVLTQLAEIAHGGERAVLIVSHDLAATAQVADRVAVLAGGRLVEVGPTETVLRSPRHPYVQALLAARPPLHAPRPRGLVQAPTAAACAQPVACCPFMADCARVHERCRSEAPVLQWRGDHGVACHSPGEPT